MLCLTVSHACTGLEGWVGDTLPGVFGEGEGAQQPNQPLMPAEVGSVEQAAASNSPADNAIQYTSNGKRK